jgi:DNA-binding GntR family transcriptional regulator
MHKSIFLHRMQFMQKQNPTVGPSLVEQAFARLRRDVLIGAHAPGIRLKLDDLQAAYGYSSSPLREALSRLSQEGLVRADDRRGFRVAAISAADFKDITRMRVLLDLPALRAAIAHGDDDWEAAILAASHRLNKLEVRLGDAPVVLDDEWSDLHRAFHLALLAACPSDRQRAWSASLFDQAERYRRLSARFRRTARRKSNEHYKLMDASLRRDADTACALLEQHILDTQANVLAAVNASHATA